LCRTEHMFLAEDRLPIVRRMILASSEVEETAALEELRAAQKQDFVAILEAWTGCLSRCACWIPRCTNSCRPPKNWRSRRPPKG